jgi:hypothetical protein
VANHRRNRLLFGWEKYAGEPTTIIRKSGAMRTAMLTQLAFYAGWPNVFSALPAVNGVLEKRPG